MIHPSKASIDKIHISQNKSIVNVNRMTNSGDPPSIIEANDKFGCCEYLLIFFSFLIFFLTFPLSLCCSIKVVQEYQRAVTFRLGRILSGKARGPGLFFILPCIDNVVIADLRTQTFDVPPQEILTKDSVTVSVDAVVYIRIFDPAASVIRVENAQYSTRTLAATTLRNIFGTKTLQEILSDRDSVARLMQEILDETTHKWGVAVERVEVKDVSLPVQMQRAMASEAEAAREARAKVIAAEGEEKASRSLRDAAKILTESPVAVQLRYLQTLTDISVENSSTIIFPVPIDMSPQISFAKSNNNHNPITRPSGVLNNSSYSKSHNPNQNKQRASNESINLMSFGNNIEEKSALIKDKEVQRALEDLEKLNNFEQGNNNFNQTKNKANFQANTQTYSKTKSTINNSNNSINSSKKQK